jgi:type II secretory pathway pseudopilin PulG
MRLVNRQDGVALPVVAGVLLLISILTGTVAATAIRSSDEANNDRSAKRALSAAEAGLKLARFRLNKLNPLDAMCVRSHTTGSYTVPPLPSTECPNGEFESLGNGASFSYVASIVGASCASVPGAPGGAIGRCITATGTVNGVTRRVQQGVSRQGVPLFANGGLIGLDLVEMKNSAQVETSIGSNGHIELGNSNQVDGALLLPPGATYSMGSSTVSEGVQTVPPFVLPPVDFAPSLASNNNSSIPSSLLDANREFRMNDSVEYSLAAGTYNFCNAEFINSNVLRIPSNGLVRIFIDSPARVGSGCRANTGRIEAVNSVEINEDAGNPANLEVYVYGTMSETAGQPDVLFNNSVKFRGVIYAPNSTIKNKNSGQYKAAFAAKNIIFTNSEQFELPDSLKKKKFGTDTGAYAKQGWVECKAQPTDPSDPESGC